MIRSKGSFGFVKMLWTIALLLGAARVVTGEAPQCSNIAWEKVRGMRPEFVKSSERLNAGIDSHGLTINCFEKCKSINCSSFMIDLESSLCLSLEPDGENLVFEPNVTFFHQICLQVPDSCLDTRLWQVERYLGAELLDPMGQTVPEVISRTDCYERCIQKGTSCKSAQFRSSEDLKIGDTYGSCTLLTVERGTKPQSYRTSVYKEEYLEIQCHNISKMDYCSYAEIQETLMPYSDAVIAGADTKECERRCDESKDGFVCRAYTVQYSQNRRIPTCYLHSEDTLAAGFSVLINSPDAVYKEREPCIDVTVRCSNTTLTIDLRTSEAFHGRIYPSGYSENCGVTGDGDKMTQLVLALPDTSDPERSAISCGLTPAFSKDQDNRTRAVIWSTVIIQFNPIIQRLGDQAIRVGCSLDGNELPTPRNITVNSGFTFTNSNAGIPPIVSTVTNSSSEIPIVTMSILDESQNRANVTHIGQKLVLKIQITPNDGPFDITAGHLIASTSTGDLSLPLLDELGCPLTNVFPALVKDPTDNRTLLTEFSAFKFPNSQHVRFNVIVRFCLEKCEPTKCNDNVQSYGRRKRSIDVSKNSTSQTTEELELEATVIVKGSTDDDEKINYKPLRTKDRLDTYVILGTDTSDGQFCMNSSLALFLLVILLIIQIVLLACCIVAVRSYRRLAMRAEEDRAHILSRHLYGIHGGNFDIGRRVHWADNSSSNFS